MIDTDGDNVRCRWATQTEASSISNVLPNARLDQVCHIRLLNVSIDEYLRNYQLYRGKEKLVKTTDCQDFYNVQWCTSLQLECTSRVHLIREIIVVIVESLQPLQHHPGRNGRNQMYQCSFSIVLLSFILKYHDANIWKLKQNIFNAKHHATKIIYKHFLARRHWCVTVQSVYNRILSFWVIWNP